ncbi:sodium- and chloride-dependent GABA transporter 2-like isoform X2 [Syngnathoides biaculeatus]|uniref:sodium- and chloride-dependent GABA transporter 2-like isoform X2 n=1 Tax=Syngnathoides biaculeatus TaxID=300417 RepID=UPI002ADE8567|nr:sodium- and chloride-dependent GABA transporter 2-like isoform X2 [Syngnathoides biaculeatus]
MSQLKDAKVLTIRAKIAKVSPTKFWGVILNENLNLNNYVNMSPARCGSWLQHKPQSYEDRGFKSEPHLCVVGMFSRACVGLPVSSQILKTSIDWTQWPIVHRCDCECGWFFFCLSPCALQLAGNQLRVYPASCPKTAERDSSTPVTLMWMSGSENGWLVYPHLLSTSHLGKLWSGRKSNSSQEDWYQNPSCLWKLDFWQQQRFWHLVDVTPAESGFLIRLLATTGDGTNGVFLIPYLLFFCTCGVPLFFLETSLGQYTRQGGITCWRKVCPLFMGLGYGSQVVVLYTVIHYIVIQAWAFLNLFLSFSSELPWTNCLNSWNTDKCFDDNPNQTIEEIRNGTSSVEEYWERRILGLTSGLEDVGNIRRDLALCLLLAWILCVFCIWNGVKSTGKVAFFTASFPYVMLLVLLVRGLTLPGAKEGIKFYLYPDASRLTDPMVWLEASGQILYSFVVSVGILTSLSSYNKYTNNCYRDSIALCLLNVSTSFVAGFAIFSVLGFMAKEQSVDISTVAKSGPSLAFIAYPRAVALMPLPQLWAICFFTMIIFLGFDSQFVYLEGLVINIVDAFPSIFGNKCRRKLLVLAVSVVSFCAGLLMVTEGGFYVFQLFDHYSCSGMTVLFFAILESVCIGWVYGADQLYENIKDMIGYQPWPFIKYCWKYLTPASCTCILVFTFVKYTPLKLNNTYEYPWWGYTIGGVLGLSSPLIVLLRMLYDVSVTPGTLKERLKFLCTPAKDLPCAKARKSLNEVEFQRFTHTE